MPPRAASRLTETYLELRGDGGVAHIPLTPAFWPDLVSGKRRLDGRLIMAAAMTEDMTHWEIHPAGDEILLLLAGRMTVVLESDGGDEETTLQAGEAFVVPQGRWHRIKVIEPGELVFMTPGEGTEHKPL